MRKVVIGALMALAAQLGISRAEEAYPSKPITLVTPFAPGGGSDYLTRVLAEAMRPHFDQQAVVVENAAGAGGTVGSQKVASAKPDGHTLLLHQIGMAVAPALYKNLRFDPLKDFEHIGLFADSPMVILARKEFPPNTFEELVAWTKEKKEDLRFSAGGVGSATHLCALLYEQGVGVPITHVQYKGGAPALLDVRSGQVELLCDVTAVITGQVQSGDLKGYVLTSRKRLDSLPNIRTSAEVGMPDLNVTAWYGLYAPAKTPKAIVERLSKVLQAVVQDPGVAAQLAKIDTPLFSPEEATPEAHRRKLAAEIALWRPIIEKTGASAE